MSDDYSNLICKIIMEIKSRRIVSSKILSKIFKIDHSMILFILNELEKRGIVERASNTDCECSVCPFSKICPYKISGARSTRDIIGEVFIYKNEKNRDICKIDDKLKQDIEVSRKVE